jgi:CysZ protein
MNEQEQRMNGFTKGAQYLLAGFQLIRQPGLRGFVMIPLALNIIVFANLGYIALDQFAGLLDVLMQSIPDWAAFIRYLLWPLFVLLLLVVSAWTFTIIGNLIASPFAGLLAEKTEALLTGQVSAASFDWKTIPAIAIRSLAREASKLVYYLGWAIIMLIVSFMVSPIAPLLWFAFGAWMMAIQYIDYPFDNHQRSFAELKRWLSQNRMTALGFGAAVLAASVIPLVNLVVIPAAICGAAALWVDKGAMISPGTSVDRI